MEFEKHGDDAEKCDLHDKTNNPYNCMERETLFSCKNLSHLLYFDWEFAGYGKNKGQDDVEEKKHKEFSVAESNAVRYPRTVMVHIEHTSLTR